MSFQDEINAQHGARQRADATAATPTPGATVTGQVAARRKPRTPGATGRKAMLAQFVKRLG